MRGWGWGFSNLLGNQGNLEEAKVKRKVLREVLNCEREQLCRMWGGRLFQTRGTWTEKDRWPKPFSFHFAQERVFSSELERRVRDGVYTERQDDRYSGRVPSKKRKAKVAILKSILSLTGSHWSLLRSGVTCSCLLLRKTTLAAWFWIFWRRYTVLLIRSDVNL